ncbi:PREDICTED: uncharacterized protein LOC108374055 [Rhagoletis zephyria]|uniref:uncharacterized protein LOC108374055 n=1 Tax=Rhagoletis zephyria TaxID=28612 RepID=UPI00081162DB|nr:PREDICTED: uncharacterized protein LOC108374055 [Rhagoletis zephyria]
MQRSPVRRSPRLHSEDLTQVPQNTGDIAKVTEACNKTTEISASTIMMNPTVSAAVAEASIANASQSPTAAAVTTTIPFRTPAVPDDIRSVVHCTYTSSQASGPCNIATPTAASRVLPILASAPTTINAAEESMIFLMQRQIANLELQLKHAQARITESEQQRQRLEPSAITSYALPYSRPLDARDFAVANNASSTFSHNGHVITRHNGTSGMQSYIGTIANSLNGLQYTAPPINMQSHMHMASANPSSSVISPTITPHSAYSQAISNTPQSVIQPPRKLMDLPEFSGQPEDWPVFHTAYTESTIAYNYSNFENNQRLNKCLKGSARESVKSLLIHPNNVGAIVEQLRVRFGRPEQLVRSQLKAVRDMPFVSEAAIGKIVPYATATKNLTVFLQSIGEEKHLVNPTLLEELVNKLPLSKRLEWARYSATIQPYPTIINFSDWLSEIASFVQMVQDSECREPRRRAVLHTNGERSIKCIMCHGLHKVSECKKFLDATVAERWEQSKRRRLCFSCLNVGHATRDCRLRKQCMVHGCQRQHHRLLHEGNASPVELVGPDSSSGSTAVLSCSAQASRRLLFRVVPVTLYGPSKRVNSYALLDEGSSITMMDKSLLEELGLHGHTREVDIQWFGGNAVKEQVAVVNLYISGVGMKKRHFLRNVHGVDKLDLPMQSLNERDIRNATRYRDRIPVTPYENVVPKVLIGLDHCHLGLPTKTMPSNHNGPYAAFTDLGCVVFGPCSISPRVSPTCLHISNAFDHQIHNMVAEYFSIESFGVKAAPPVKSAADQRAKRMLEETTVKVDGRFQTGLLWRRDNIKLPESYNMALQRLVGIERKIERNKNFGKEYRNIVKTYINKKYARKLEPHEVVKCNERTWYLPHFAVANPRKPGKLRLVFDAAATTDGVSLNSQLLKGPQQYRPLVSVLFHFREGAFAVCADIQEMYHQVLIRPEDRCAQRFLWRDAERGKAPEVYEMTAMTFGAACSPCAAHYVKVKNALEHRSHDPRAIRAITEYHYVDDYVDSFDSETQAIQIAQQVRDIHKDAGFNLRKFTSNSTKVAEALGGVKRALPILSKEGAEFEKVLGMLWQPPDDSFAYQLEFYRVDSSVIEGKRIPTKRELLSIVMSIFDPLGFLSHFTISAKLVLRELWKRSIGWDEPVPNEVNAMWCVFRKQLLKVVECRVPRHYFQMGPSRELQLHVFVDASENAFSAAAYWRSENMNRIIEVSLVYAKTRSAPIKPLTIPRLELQAAVLGTRMMTTIISEHSVRANRCVMWSDSKTVLKWLFSKHRRYKPFVAHRIAEILDVTKPSDWRWVPTNQNVADEATRPNKAINLSPSSRWFTGPEFLYNNEQLWPKDADVADEAEDDEEEIRTKFAFIVIKKSSCLGDTVPPLLP